jgi:aldehyde dehydrogenase (NAD+)
MANPEKLEHYIGGQWVAGSGEQILSINPSDTTDQVAFINEAGPELVGDAVKVAREAQPGWAAAGTEYRADLLDRVGDHILRHTDELAFLLAREEGKAMADAVGETQRAGRLFKYFAGEAIRCGGRNLDSVRPGVDTRTSRVPIGVFALITPWNFPIAIPAWKAAPALAFGNTVVMKPSPLTSAVADALAKIIDSIGFPDGVFNLVHGDAVTGAALSSSAEIDGVSFTGSQAVGKHVANTAVQIGTKVQLEMGGKNPLVVLDDAHLKTAVDCAVNGAFYSTGQRCTASSRIIVTEGIHDEFVAALTVATSKLVVGDARDAKTQIGPLASAAQLEKSLSYISIAQKEGAGLVAGGSVLELGTPGFYLQPALLVGTTPEMRINQEEVFGPVASVIKVADYDEALSVANRTSFGLSAGICTTNLRFASHFEKNAQAGMVMVNLPTAGVDYHVPFGGSKASSYGAREQGFAAVEFYTQVRTSYVAA